jgi:transketolase
MKKAFEIRSLLYKLHKEAKASHIASSLSCLDILMTIAKVLKHNDELILSKGHAVSAWYAVKGVEDMRDLPKHATRGSLINVSSGSLGQGLSIACGLATADRGRKVYVVMGDGECQEGQVWEALAFASHHKLNNIRLFIDNNKFQACGRTAKILSIDPIDKRIQSFGWNVKKCYGHGLEELKTSLNMTLHSELPVAIIANTTKGKGFDYMENSNEYHYRCPE